MSEKKPLLSTGWNVFLMIFLGIISALSYFMAFLGSLGNIDTVHPPVYDQSYFAFIALSVFCAILVVVLLIRVIKNGRRTP